MRCHPPLQHFPVWRAAIVAALVVCANAAQAIEPGCPGSADPNPSILFCDDFDDGIAVSAKWNAYNDNGGRYVPVAGVGVDGSTAMWVEYRPGVLGAGGFSIGLGELPAYYLPGGGGENWQHVISPESNFREIYWRQYLRMEAGWSGIPGKFSRVRVLTPPQPGDRAHPTAFQGHFWQQPNANHGGTLGGLMFDNTRGVDDNGNVIDRGNNSGTSYWLPKTRGSTAIFQDYPQGSAWICIEAHVRLNEPGMQNGIEEFWVDNQLDARRTDQNHIGVYTQYGINQVVFDNYWNGGSPQTNILYRDNIVLSKQRIGCLKDGLPNALIFNDGAKWTIGSGGSPDEFVFVRNAGCGSGIDPCPVPGLPTTVNIEAGVVTGAAAVYDSSSIVMSGGEIGGDLSAFGGAAVVMSGGTVYDHLDATEASNVELSGGSVLSFLAASEDASVAMSGGQVQQFIYAANNATIEIIGSNFAVDGNPAPYGDLAESSGILTGTLESGEAISNTFYQGDATGFYSGTIRLVPEPDALLMLSGGVGTLLLLRPNDRHQSKLKVTDSSTAHAKSSVP
jgi:hypothetical protein